MLAYKDVVLMGTTEALLHVYDAEEKCHVTTLPPLPHSILNLTLVPHTQQIIAGCANGTIAVFDGDEIVSNACAKPSTIVDVNEMMMTEESEQSCVYNMGVTCVALTRNHVLCSYGPFVCKLRTDDFTMATHWRTSRDHDDVTVHSIAVSKNHTFTASCGSHVIEVWGEDKHEEPWQLDCCALLRGNGCQVSVVRGNVLCMCMVDDTVLWVGLESGHVLLVDTLHTRPLLRHVIKRYGTSVGVLTKTLGPRPLILTSGRGFIQALHGDGCQGDGCHGDDCHSNGCYDDDGGDFSSVLCWENDILKQKFMLESERSKREEMASEMIQNQVLSS